MKKPPIERLDGSENEEQLKLRHHDLKLGLFYETSFSKCVDFREGMNMALSAIESQGETAGTFWFLF